jgi:UDPglucose--hexose-1-phosphate uridylyltransferase
MPEYRQDPLSRRWVIIGSDRGGRPNEFVEATTRQSSLSCPFCAGHEGETPPAIASYSANGSGDWSVRVVPNKYPALTAEESLCPACQPLSRALVAESIPGFGLHEVIIESPRHVASLSELTPAEAELVFVAYRDRLRILKAVGRYQYVQIFKNVGPAAGASLEHVHSQLVALPGIPEVLQQELRSSLEHFQQTRRSLLGQMIEEELAAGIRIVAQTANLVAWCPAAGRFPYEVWVAPRRQASRFEAAEAGELGELATIMHDVIGRIEVAAGLSAYNYFLHTSPFDAPACDHYHWHFEIVPRLTKVAGFEWGTGCYINPLPPEAAAQVLQAISPR